MCALYNDNCSFPSSTMIDLEQWRASIGLHNAGSSRALARIPGKRRLAGSVYQLAETWLLTLAATIMELPEQCPLLLLLKCYSLLLGVIACIAACTRKLRQTSVSELVCFGSSLSLSLLQVQSGDVERSLIALAILLIMAGDVEQNPGPRIGMCFDAVCVCVCVRTHACMCVHACLCRYTQGW